jgi:hypothetical protein
MASSREDILIDLTTGNYLVVGGDFVIGDSRTQEAVSIIRASQNEYKHYPLVGCNSATWNNAIISKQDAQRVIKRQLEADGLQPNDLDIEFNG